MHNVVLADFGATLVATAGIHVHLTYEKFKLLKVESDCILTSVHVAGIVFAKRLGNRELAERLKSLATHHSVSEELIQLADMAPETFNPQECKQVIAPKFAAVSCMK